VTGTINAVVPVGRTASGAIVVPGVGAKKITTPACVAAGVTEYIHINPRGAGPTSCNSQSSQIIQNRLVILERKRHVYLLMKLIELFS
jgi:hypothetical protein